MCSKATNFMECINNIDVDDLQYVETDLCFYQLVSLGFLLYGYDRSHSEFILQRLIILSQNPPKGKGLKQLVSSDILRNYAKINPQTWKEHIVEALAIIRAKRVLRKLGIPWEDIHHHYLPNVAEIAVHVHPLLKALYKISERLAPDQAGRLISYINDKSATQHLRFYDVSYLEVFLLNWMTKHIIAIGDYQLKGSNVQILIEYFKFNDMYSLKDILLETINQNTKEDIPPPAAPINVRRNEVNTFKDSGVSMSREMVKSCNTSEENGVGIGERYQQQQQNEFDAAECYTITTKNAGYVLIINQSDFYEESDETLKDLLPHVKFNPKRAGTDVDRDKLKELFSSFGYIPLVFNNLKHLEILHHIRETVKKSIVKDSLIVCILSHGMEGVIYGCNSIPITITEIKDIMTADSLKGKPKMLIVQACQKHVSKLDTSSTKTITEFTPEAYADMLVAMSSIPGTEALRHTISGSWFIKSLCMLTEKDGNRKHMLDILTAVTRDVSKKIGDENEVMLPTTSTTLRKELYLPPRVKKT